MDRTVLNMNAGLSSLFDTKFTDSRVRWYHTPNINTLFIFYVKIVIKKLVVWLNICFTNGRNSLANDS
jgi:hypothetical protein